jgi:cytochrome P450
MRNRRDHPGHWMSMPRLLLRTRRARRAADAGAVLRAVARGASTAVGGQVRGQRFLLLLDPALAGRLLADLASGTTKSPGLQRTRVLLGDGLLTSEGDAHRRARRLVAPAFSPRRLAAYTEGFSERTEVHVGHWSDGAVLEMRQQMARLTLDIVGSTLLGMDLRQDADDVRTALESALYSFAGGAPARAFRRRGGPRLPGRQAAAAGTQPGDGRPGDGQRGEGRPGDGQRGEGQRGEGLRARLDAIVAKIIEARRGEPSADRGDVVSALLAATAGPDGLTPAEVHDHVITLIMAGHETTANALSWTLYLLSSHPEAEQALHAELARLEGRRPGFEDLARLTYTRAVITESMRLFPPAWILSRTLTADADFGGWHAPAGTLVAVSPLLLHHDARWFPEPERFDPSRWIDGRRDAVPRHAYLPFGTGPRSCIGEQFAWAEATTALAVICSRWTARTVSGTMVTPQYRVTMRPSPGLPMQVTAR